MLVKFVFLD